MAALKGGTTIANITNILTNHLNCINTFITDVSIVFVFFSIGFFKLTLLH